MPCNNPCINLPTDNLRRPDCCERLNRTFGSVATAPPSTGITTSTSSSSHRMGAAVMLSKSEKKSTKACRRGRASPQMPFAICRRRSCKVLAVGGSHRKLYHQLERGYSPVCMNQERRPPETPEALCRASSIVGTSTAISDSTSVRVLAMFLPCQTIHRSAQPPAKRSNTRELRLAVRHHRQIKSPGERGNSADPGGDIANWSRETVLTTLTVNVVNTDGGVKKLGSMRMGGPQRVPSSP